MTTSLRVEVPQRRSKAAMQSSGLRLPALNNQRRCDCARSSRKCTRYKYKKRPATGLDEDEKVWMVDGTDVFLRG